MKWHLSAVVCCCSYWYVVMRQGKHCVSACFQQLDYFCSEGDQFFPVTQAVQLNVKCLGIWIILHSKFVTKRYNTFHFAEQHLYSHHCWKPSSLLAYANICLWLKIIACTTIEMATIPIPVISTNALQYI